MELAPIVLFVYNRLEHTKKTIDALKNNTLAAESNLTIYSDGPKSDNDIILIKQLREYLKKIKGFNSIKIVENSTNKGLADSIIIGVSEIIENSEKIIVLEDDIITSPYFLQYMNASLEKYKNIDKVMHISAYQWDIFNEDLPESFFMRQASCWGWGTWKRAWKYFNNDCHYFIKTFDNKKIKKFNLDGSYDYWSQIIANYNEEKKTWAVFWNASVFEQNGLCLHPFKSLTENIGFDGSGENCKIDYSSAQNILQSSINFFPDLNNDMMENEIASIRLHNYLKKSQSTISKIIRILYKVLRKYAGKILRIIAWTGLIKAISKIYFHKVTFGKGVQITGVSDISIGAGSCISDNVWLNTNVRGHGKSLVIGNKVLIGRNSVCSSSDPIEIGDYTFTNTNVLISNSLHTYKDVNKLYIENAESCGKLIIEENCWIGFGAVIYGNIIIGRGSVIGANSVITKDIPPFSVVTGNPQKIVKMYNPVSMNWEKIKEEKDLLNIIELRNKKTLPDRDEYLNILNNNSKLKKIDPLCAGRGLWI